LNLSSAKKPSPGIASTFFMIRKILTRHSSITEATVILAVASLVSRFFGLIRDRTLASHFGAGTVLDSYFAAFKIPDLVFNLLILGALSSVFIPIFTEYLRKNQKEAWVFTNSLLNIGVAFLSLILLILFVFAPTLAHLVAPGFDPERLTLVIGLMRIMLLSPLIFGLSNLAGGILNSYRNFFVYSLAPILYNLGIIAGVIFIVPLVGPLGLAYGVVLGALLHLLIQIPSVFLSGYRYRPSFNLRHPALKRLGVLMLPRTLGLATGQLSLLANTIIASTLAMGSIAVLNLADNIYSLPVSLFGISLAVAAFPTLSDQAARGSWTDFRDTLRRLFRQVLFLIIPTMLFYWIFRAQIIRLILGAGLFGWEDTRFTVSVLAFLTFGMVAHATIPLLARAFYARKDTATPFLIGLVALAINILAALILISFLKVVGLALAISLAALSNLAGLILILQRRIHWLKWGEASILIAKLILSSLAAAASGYLMLRIADLIVDTHTVLGLFLQTAFSGLVFLFIYLTATQLFRVPEVNLIRRPLSFIKTFRR